MNIVKKVLSSFVVSAFAIAPCYGSTPPIQRDPVADALLLYKTANESGQLARSVRKSTTLESVPDKFPLAEIKGDSIYVSGAKYPLKIRNLAKGEFLLNNFVLKFDGKLSDAAMIEKISAILGGKSSDSRFSYLVPQARAFVFIPAAMGIWTVGSALALFACLGNAALDPKSVINKDPTGGASCVAVGALWPVIAAVMLVAYAYTPSSAKADELKLDCKAAGGVGVAGAHGPIDTSGAPLSASSKVPESAVSASKYVLEKACAAGLESKINQGLRSAAPGSTAPAPSGSAQ